MKLTHPEKNVIVITGCSSGFGKLMATDFARQGHIVYASMRTPDGKNRLARQDLEELAAKEQSDLTVLELDVTDDASVERAVAQVVSRSGRIDVLVNNAGVMSHGISEGFSLDSIQQQFDVNVLGPARAIRAVLPHMREQQSGLLVQFSSLAGRYVFPFAGIYCAGKFAVEALAESYRYELASFNIDSVIVEPGNYASNLVDNSPGPDDETVVQGYGEELAAVGANVLKALHQLNNKDGAPQAQEVVDAVSRLIAMKYGERPLRTVVKGQMDLQVDEYNKMAATFQSSMLTGMGYL